MNRKGGVYTIGIALIAMVLLSLTIFSTEAIMHEEESEDYIAVMSDVRMAWQNTALLLDGAFRDAMQGACPGGPADPLVMDGYFNSIHAAMNNELDPGVDCQFSAVPGSFIAGDPASYTVDLRCLRFLEIGGERILLVEYGEEITLAESCP